MQEKNSQRVRVMDLLDLRTKIQNVLCEFYHLQPGAFPLSERVLTKQGTPCGMLFCLHGPRSVKLTAVSETISNTVLFYDSTGQRRQKLAVDMNQPCEQLALAS